MTKSQALVALFVLLPASALADIVVDVSLNTTPLVGHPAAPFFLNFQFTDGSGTGDANNTVTLSDFAFGPGGAAVGSPSLIGGASGDVTSGVSLTDSSFSNLFTQQFTPGNELSFVLSLTTNVDAGPQPDEFSFAILDNSGFEIPSLSPTGALLVTDINSSSPVIQTFATDSTTAPFGGGNPIAMDAPSVQPVQTVVPEPGSLVLTATLISLLAAAYRLLKSSRTGTANDQFPSRD
jgi:hypothetical protein